MSPGAHNNLGSSHEVCELNRHAQRVSWWIRDRKVAALKWIKIVIKEENTWNRAVSTPNDHLLGRSQHSVLSPVELWNERSRHWRCDLRIREIKLEFVLIDRAILYRKTREVVTVVSKVPSQNVRISGLTSGRIHDHVWVRVESQRALEKEKEVPFNLNCSHSIEQESVSGHVVARKVEQHHSVSGDSTIRVYIRFYDLVVLLHVSHPAWMRGFKTLVHACNWSTFAIIEQTIVLGQKLERVVQFVRWLAVQQRHIITLEDFALRRGRAISERRWFESRWIGLCGAEPTEHKQQRNWPNS
jgi:hypothetical protein